MVPFGVGTLTAFTLSVYAVRSGVMISKRKEYTVKSQEYTEIQCVIFTMY